MGETKCKACSWEGGFHAQYCYIEQVKTLELQNEDMKKFRDEWKRVADIRLEQLEVAERLLDAAKKGWNDDLKWAMDRNAMLILTLEQVRDSGNKEGWSQAVAQSALAEKRNYEVPALRTPEPGRASPAIQVCDSCGWNNDANHGGGSRVMYTMGKVAKCGECLPATR